mmetsp:Transcript_33974/g.101437  ORF Transcript_33974/g.101437 Transcript_33974/m.101437 type:complete len:207 (+) Transcript_33974:1042-1662(+)
MTENVDVRQYVRMIYAGYGGHTRIDARGDDPTVDPLAVHGGSSSSSSGSSSSSSSSSRGGGGETFHIVVRYLGIELQCQFPPRRQCLHCIGKVSYSLVKFFLPGDAFRHVELSADFGGAIVQRHTMTDGSGRRREGHARGSRPHHAYAESPILGYAILVDDELGLVTRPRIDEARCGPADERVIETRLIARYARIDFLGFTLATLV